eukprot:SAG11_NODE_849_length_6877_cov_15.646946_5_plen_57_part_00
MLSTQTVPTGGLNVSRGTRSTSTEVSVLYGSSVGYKIEQYYDEDCSYEGVVRLVGN